MHKGRLRAVSGRTTRLSGASRTPREAGAGVGRGERRRKQEGGEIGRGASYITAAITLQVPPEGLSHSHSRETCAVAPRPCQEQLLVQQRPTGCIGCDGACKDEGAKGLGTPVRTFTVRSLSGSDFNVAMVNACGFVVTETCPGSCSPCHAMQYMRGWAMHIQRSAAPYSAKAMPHEAMQCHITQCHVESYARQCRVTQCNRAKQCQRSAMLRAKHAIAGGPHNAILPSSAMRSATPRRNRANTRCLLGQFSVALTTSMHLHGTG